MNKETQAIIWANAFASHGANDIEASIEFADNILKIATEKYNSL